MPVITPQPGQPLSDPVPSKIPQPRSEAQRYVNSNETGHLSPGLLKEDPRRADDPLGRPSADVPLRGQACCGWLYAGANSGKDAFQPLVTGIRVRLGGGTRGTGLVTAARACARAAVSRSPHRGPLPQRGGADPPVRNIAQGAKTIISQLPELRNRFGTGHGRVLTPEIDDELAFLSLDAALLWARWVLRRLEQLLAGRPLSLVEALQGGIFYRGDLRNRLQAVQLPGLDPAVQRQIGVAVAHRAMGGTHNVRVEGVDECAEQPELDIWPAGYRVGLLEGLFLDRQGYVDVTAWGAQAAAAVIAPVPSAGDVVQELADKVGQAAWAYQFASNVVTRDGAVAAMRDALAVLPNSSTRDAWNQIVQRFQPDPPIADT